jgi:hypothetical protein
MFVKPIIILLKQVKRISDNSTEKLQHGKRKRSKLDGHDVVVNVSSRSD